MAKGLIHETPASTSSDDKELRSLLRLGVLALQEEDTTLAKLFMQAELSPFDRFYDDVSHGLNYWLFETTLMYTIFKAWIPFVPVRWEDAQVYRTKSPEQRRSADLAVYHHPDGTPRWVFEGKWWQTNQRKMLDALEADMTRVRAFKPDAEGYVLTFWSGFERSLEEDIQSVRRQAGELSGWPAQEAYLAAFRCDSLAARRDNQAGYFALAAWRA